MMRSSLLAAFLVVIIVPFLYFAFRAWVQANRSGLKEVPGPTLARYTNLILKWYVLSGNRSRYIDSLHQRYGPVVRISPNEVAFADLSAVRSIYGVAVPFPKAPWYQICVPQPQPGLFAMPDRERHTARRRLFAPAFSKASMLKWEEQFKEKIAIAVEKIKRDATSGYADIFLWFTYLTTDIIGDLAFGDSFDILSQEKKPPYVEDLENYMMIGGILAEFQPFMPVVKRLPLPALQHLLVVGTRLRKFGQRAVRNARARSVANPTIFSKMIHEGEGGKQLSDDAIADEAGNLMIAGGGTTAVTMTYLVWCVLRHPEERDLLLKELRDCTPNPTLAQLEALPYLNGVIEETLRLYTAAPGTLPRTVPANAPALAGYNIPAGTVVGAQAYTLHRNANAFPDPLRWDPSRWFNATTAMKEHYMPWGIGSRSCLGIYLAKLELLHTVFALFRACPDLVLAPTTTAESMDIEDYFLISPASHKCEVTLG